MAMKKGEQPKKVFGKENKYWEGPSKADSEGLDSSPLGNIYDKPDGFASDFYDDYDDYDDSIYDTPEDQKRDEITDELGEKLKVLGPDAGLYATYRSYDGTEQSIDDLPSEYAETISDDALDNPYSDELLSDYEVKINLDNSESGTSVSENVKEIEALYLNDEEQDEDRNSDEGRLPEDIRIEDDSVVVPLSYLMQDKELNYGQRDALSDVLDSGRYIREDAPSLKERKYQKDFLEPRREEV